MFNLSAETPLTLAEAAKRLPPGRGGKTVHLSCVLRWVLDGCKGIDGCRVRLEALRLGGRWVTSEEAIQRFAERLTPRFEDDAKPSPRTPTARQRAVDKAEHELAAAGI